MDTARPHIKPEAQSPSLGEIAIRAEGLHKRYGPNEALRGVGFEVRSGEIYGLLGPNGAGKSTTINILSGSVQPDRGVAQIHGYPAGSTEARRALGVVPQELALYTELDARDNLKFFGQLYGLGGSVLRSRIESTLEMVDLAGRSKEAVGKYSGGILRRLNIAAGILHSPKVVLMDEPTVGLDPQNRQRILELVRSIASAGAAVIYTTHYMDEVEQLCGRLAIIDHGQLLIEGTLAELQRTAGHQEMVTLRGTFSNTSSRTIAQTCGDVDLLKSTDDEIVLTAGGTDKWLQSLLACAGRAGEVREAMINRQSLEALFIKLTGRDLRE